MGLLPFGDLPPYRNREFVPKALDWEDWDSVSGLFDALEREAAAAATVEQIELWLLRWSELNSALDEEAARRYIAMTCHTDSEEAKGAYLRMLENVEPKVKPRQFALAKLFVEHPVRASLPAERYHVFDRQTALHVELFRQENVPLETEEARLGQQYQELTGSITVQFLGEEQTLVQMGRYLEEPDRALRQQAWEKISERRLRERETFEGLFDQMAGIRSRIAANAGFANYRDYAFRARGRFDYTPGDCLSFHDAIESEVMPVVASLQRERRRQLELESLRPWDMAVDPLGRPPLKPFTGVDELVERCQAIFDRLDGDLAEGFRTMGRLRLLDLDNRKGKAPGGYQSTLSEARLPFIFTNAVGLHRDVETMLHEAGHAFHALATRTEDLYDYRDSPLEFAEVASMSMELLGGEYIEEFYAEADAARARRQHLEGIITFLPWMAFVDALQHWIYTHPGHTPDERASASDSLMRRFGGEVDWTGFEEARRFAWHRQLHIFLHPFYYVEYGIAQLGALQVWANSRSNGRSGLDAYKRALAIGGARTLPELFQAAGCRFAFDSATIRPLMQMMQQELDSLPA